MVTRRSNSFVIFFLLFILSFTNYGQETNLDCSSIKKGRFLMAGPQGGSIKIKRTKKLQIERYSRQKISYKFYIEWIEDCTYILKLKKSRIRSLIDKSEIEIRVTITSLDKHYYTAQITGKNKTGFEEIEIQIK